MIQYLGGELLAVEPARLRELVALGRNHFQHRLRMEDCAQTNLLGSSGRVAALRQLFEGRIGTSVDHFSGQRRLGGSAERYAALQRIRLAEVGKKSAAVPAVLVVDRETISYVSDEIRLADRGNYHLTLRPVYPGASAVQLAGVADLGVGYVAAFTQWFRMSRVVVEPFYGMLQRRLTRFAPGGDKFAHSCHFQRDCLPHHMHVEPNGEVYQCMEFADMARKPFANAITGVVDDDLIAVLRGRAAQVEAQCGRCEFFAECQGGCGAEALSRGGSYADRTYMCPVWRALFVAIDEAIQTAGYGATARWIEHLETLNQRRRARVADELVTVSDAIYA